MTTPALDAIDKELAAISNNQTDILKAIKDSDDSQKNTVVNFNNLHESIDTFANEITSGLSQFKNSVQGDLMAISELKSMVADGFKTDEVVKEARELITCKLCTQVPNPGELLVSGCCGQILGCGPCINRWLTEDANCHLCRKPPQAFPFRGLDNLIMKLK